MENLYRPQSIEHLLLSQSDYIVVFKDTDLRYRYVNSAYMKFMGFENDFSVIGKTDFELFSGKASMTEIGEYISNDSRAMRLREGESLNTEERCTGPDGEERVFRSKKFPLYRQGVLLGTGTITTEITASVRTEKQVRDYHALLETIINTIPGSINVVDSNMRITFCGGNDIDRGHDDYSDAPGNYCYTYFHNRQAACPWCRLSDVLQNGESVVEIVPKDDPRHLLCGKALKVFISPIKDGTGGIIGALEYSIDVTDIQSLADKSRELNRMKDLFLSRFSHDIRNPMNSLVGILSMVEERQDDPVSRDFIVMARNSAKTIMSMTDEILEVGRNDEFPQPGDEEQVSASLLFSPDEVFFKAAELFRYSALEKGLELRIRSGDLPDRVWGNPRYLHRVVLNLVSNSVKYTEKGRVDVLLSRYAHKNSTVVLQLTVTDTGCGIPPEITDRIYEPYFRGPVAASGRISGTGIGLSSVKQVIDAIDGTIHVESGDNGTVFTAMLPFKL